MISELLQFLQSSQNMTFEGKPKQQFQISHGNSIQQQSIGMTFEGKPKQQFQISHGNGIQQSSQGITFEGISKPKQVFEISHGNGIQQSSQGITFEGIQKPKQVFEISSSHGQSSSQGMSFIAQKPNLVPSTNSITFEGKEPVEYKKSDPSKYQISSSGNSQNNTGIGISYIAPDKKPLLAVTSGITLTLPEQCLPDGRSSAVSGITSRVAER